MANANLYAIYRAVYCLNAVNMKNTHKSCWFSWACAAHRSIEVLTRVWLEYGCVPLICIDWHFLCAKNKFVLHVFCAVRIQYVTWRWKSTQFVGPFFLPHLQLAQSELDYIHTQIHTYMRILSVCVCVWHVFYWFVHIRFVCSLRLSTISVQHLNITETCNEQFASWQWTTRRYPLQILHIYISSFACQAAAVLLLSLTPSIYKAKCSLD